MKLVNFLLGYILVSKFVINSSLMKLVNFLLGYILVSKFLINNPLMKLVNFLLEHMIILANSFVIMMANLFVMFAELKNM